MGAAASAPGAAAAAAAPALPLKYGELGEGGAVLALASLPSAAPPLLLAASAAGVSQYNFISGDRAAFLPAPAAAAPFTAAALCAAAAAAAAADAHPPPPPPPPLLALGCASGEVLLLHAQALTQVRAPLLPAAPPAAPPSPVTALAFLPPATLFVGHGDGRVRSWCLASGALQRTYPPPAAASAAPGLAVAAIALCLAPPTPAALKAAAGSGAAAAAAPGGGGGGPLLQLLAVGHASGMLALHEGEALAADSSSGGGGGGARLSFPPPSPPLLTAPLSGLLFLRSLNCLAAYARGCNTLVLLDIAKGRLVALDFAAELASVARSYARLSAAAWDDARGCMLVGGDDGAVYVRGIARIAGTGDVAVTLVRVAPPAAASAAPAPILSLLYHSRADALLCGDASGLVRRLRGVVGGGGGAGGAGGAGGSAEAGAAGAAGVAGAGAAPRQQQQQQPAPPAQAALEAAAAARFAAPPAAAAAPPAEAAPPAASAGAPLAAPALPQFVQQVAAPGSASEAPREDEEGGVGV